MQRYINAAFALLVVPVFAVGIYVIEHEDPSTAKTQQPGLDGLNAANSTGGTAVGMATGLLLVIVCLVVFPRFRMMVIGPVGAPIDNPGQLIGRLIRMMNGLVVVLAFVLIVAGKLGSLLP